MTDVNDELMVEVLRRIETDPVHWRQSSWGERTECGTTACFAGHTVLAAAPDEITWYRTSELSELMIVGGRRWNIAIRAQKLLGLTWEQRELLFYTDRDIDTIYKVCAGIMGIDETVLRDKVKDRI